MKCPGCQFENPEGMKFCVECGIRLLVHCSSCQAEMLASFRFCGECGTTLLPEPPQQRSAASLLATRAESRSEPPTETGESLVKDSDLGERKQVTVLVCSLVLPESEEGPLILDEQHTLLSSFLELAKPEIERFGGTINRFLSQGFMALFGAPVAWEDHPHRAIFAAFELRDGVVRQIESRDLAPSIRIGIDTGAVVVGGLGSMAIGAATTRARRLEKEARPGEILLTERTGEQVRGQVTLDPCEPVVIEGQPVTIHRAQSSKGRLAPSRTRQGETLSPLVGRSHELSILDQLRNLADQERGQVVSLVGEAGAGKSRLLQEFRQSDVLQGVNYLRGQCLSYGGGIPYLPFIDMIRQTCQIGQRDEPDKVVEKLRTRLEQIETSLESLPFFLRLLGLERGTETLEALEPQAIQARTFAALRRMLLDAGRHSLVVLEIEDLHWIDDTSAELLESLIGVMAGARLLVVLTYRPDHQPGWSKKSFATHVPIRRLTEEDSRRLVSNILERSEQRLDVDEELLGKAEGNPLFLEELTHALLERGPGGEGVPDTVQGILMARIDALPKTHRRLLRTASVLGRMLNQELLELIWDGEPIEPLLEDLQRWELIYKTPSEDQPSYRFKHTLTQEVAYGSLLSSRRRDLHARAAMALEAQYADHLEEAYHQLVHHYPKAEEPKKTVHYLTLFAQRAAQDYAHAEATKALREALRHIDQLAEGERDRRQVQVLLQLAESLLPLAAFPETLELFEANLERLEKLGEPALESRFYFWLAHTHTYLGHQEATHEYAEKSIAAAQQAKDEATEGKARYVLGRDGFWSGNFSNGIQNSLRAVVLLERTGEAWWQGQAYWVAGFNHYALGHFDQGIEALEQCCGIGEALDDHRLDASWSLGYFYASLGDAEKGIESCRKGVDKAQDPLNSAVAMGFLGYAMLVRGEDFEGAIERLQTAIEQMRQAGMQQLESWFQVFLGEVLLKIEELEAAQESAEKALELAEQARFQYGIGLAYHALGRVGIAAGRLQSAAKHLEKGQALFEDLSVPFEIGRIRLDQAKIARRLQAPDRAAANQKEALEIFDKLGVESKVRRAEVIT